MGWIACFGWINGQQMGSWSQWPTGILRRMNFSTLMRGMGYDPNDEHRRNHQKIMSISTEFFVI